MNPLLLLKVHRGAAMPRFSAMTFRSWARSHKAPPGTTRTVAYFHGCAAQEFEPEVGAAVVRVLERNGARVTFPRQGCCGLPLVSNGDFDAGRSYASRLVRHLRASADDPGVIVASSTSCGMTLKAKYRELLGLDDADTRSVSRAVYDICEYLVGLDDDGSLNRSLAPIRARALYHPPCQLMAHGVGLPALDLVPLADVFPSEPTRPGNGRRDCGDDDRRDRGERVAGRQGAGRTTPGRNRTRSGKDGPARDRSR